MSLTRTAGFVVAAGAIAALLAGASPASRRAVGPALPPSTPAVDLEGAALSAEIARLRERLRPEVEPRTPSRNPFAFGGVQSTRAPRAEPVVAPPVVDVPQPAAAPPRLALVGIAEDHGVDGPVRTAIVTVGDELVLAVVGDAITPRYRVLAIHTAGVEISDAETGRSVHLRLD